MSNMQNVPFLTFKCDTIKNNVSTRHDITLLKIDINYLAHYFCH